MAATKNPTVLPVTDLPLKDGRFLEVKVRHQKSGMNYFTYQQEKGGYFVHISVVTIKDGMRSFMLGQGIKLLVEEAERFNFKKLQGLVSEVMKLPDFKRVVEKVCEEHKVELVTPLP